jgi:hypothetical protein
LYLNFYAYIRLGQYLEVVEDLTTLSFLEAFRCFIAHHSRPAIIMSDNAKTFEKGAKVFQKIFRDPLTTKHLETKHKDFGSKSGMAIHP